MSDTRYGHSNVSGGNQDQGERKDDGWQSRQGGGQSREPGRRGDAATGDGRNADRSLPPPGTNTQGELAGIGSASRDTREELDRIWRRGLPSEGEDPDSGVSDDEDPARTGTDQPPRMGGPLGPDPERPHLPEGAQNGQTRGTGAGGFDPGVDASVVGAVHQGVKEEDVRDAG